MANNWVMDDNADPGLRSFSDPSEVRKRIFGNVLSAAQSIKPLTNSLHTMALSNIQYAGPEHYTLAQQKQAIIKGESLNRRLRGTITLTDNATGNKLDEKELTLANVPYMTNRGTFINGGSEWSLSSQLRLRPGIYTRIKENGELEAHANIAPGKGVSHHYLLDPEAGVFKFNIGQSNIPLLPILRAMGTTDAELKDAWGSELLARNLPHDSPHVLDKIYKRLTRKPDPELPFEGKQAAVAKRFVDMGLDPEVTKRTLGQPFTNLTKEAIVATTKKLLAVQKGEAEADDRDAMHFQTVHGPEDLLAERLHKDRKTLSDAFWKASFKRNLSSIFPGFLTKTVNAAIMTSGLGGNPEEINALELLDQQHKVTRLGEGGISSTETVPDSSRAVQPTQLGYIDLIKTPECYSDDTSVMTARGFKPWPAITRHDLIACLVNGRLEFHKPIQLHKYEYSGELYGIKNTNIDCLVTPGHRMMIKLPDGNWGTDLIENIFRKQVRLMHCPSEHSKLFYVDKQSCIPDGYKEIRVFVKDYYQEHYDGFVYCATVPGGVLYVKRGDGKGFWSGNSNKVGIDSRLSYATKKGVDGRIYSPFVDPKTKKLVYKSPQDISDAVIAFPNELRTNEPVVHAMVNGRIKHVPRNAVTLEMPEMEYAFSPLTNMIPMKSASKGQRVSMGARMLTQALPLQSAEAPLVQSGTPDNPGESFEDRYGPFFGAVKAPKGGRVLSVSPDEIKVKYDDGTPETHELYNTMVFNRKSFLHNTPMVGVGDRFAPGQLLAKSNHTDANGTMAIGVNPRVAFLPYKGMNYEDAIVVSDKFARNLKSEHAYQHTQDVDENTKIGKHSYIGVFPGKYTRDTLKNIDDNGLVKPGTVVNYGDPLILSVRHKEFSASQLHRKRGPSFVDATTAWEHHAPGIVTDVSPTKTGVNVTVRSYVPTQVGDKLSNRFGGKGVISHIVPDDEMPVGEDGEPFEVLLNPMGLISRQNASQIIEMALSKVAAKTGKPYKVQDFKNINDLTAFAQNELKKHSLKDTETIVDPKTGRKIPGVLTGRQYILKLHHVSESKDIGRGLGQYTADEIPSKGGEEGSKRVALMSVNALLSAGATEVIRDAHLIRGQKNDAFWAAFQAGLRPPTPSVPMVYNKFINYLKGAGINVVRDGTQMHIMALTNKDIDSLAGNRVLKNSETVNWKSSEKPIDGGLFDPRIFGGKVGHDGTNWGAIALNEPMPNPAMEEPIRRLLDLTQQQFEDIVAGKRQINGQTGTKAISDALSAINVNRELQIARAEIAGGKKTARDKAIRKLGYLKGLAKFDMKPSDWMLTKVPVVPPVFRPVSIMANTGSQLIADANYLYKEVFDANENLKKLKEHVANPGEERLTLYNAFKGVVGLGDPIQPKHKEKQIGGLLKHVLGSSPKYSLHQSKLLGSNVDIVGRAAITPNVDLDMDHVGIPEERAWTIYKPFIVRRLVRSGMGKLDAATAVTEQKPVAKQAMLDEMRERPVIIDRAPVLHRYGVMAFWPTITKGHTLQVSPIITKGFGADFDGDAMQYHVPVSEDAVEEAVVKMMPSRNLLSINRFAAHYLPQHEYLGGLWSASTAKEDKRPRVFRNKQDAVTAYRRGEIGVGQPVEILEH